MFWKATSQPQKTRQPSLAHHKRPTPQISHAATTAATTTTTTTGTRPSASTRMRKGLLHARPDRSNP